MGKNNFAAKMPLKRCVQILLLSFVAGLPSAARAGDVQTHSTPADINASAADFARIMSGDLAPLVVTVMDPDTLEIRAPNGSKTDLNLGLLRKACVQPKTDRPHCVKDALEFAVGMLRLADPTQLRAQLAIEQGITWVFSELHDAVPFHMPAFGE